MKVNVSTTLLVCRPFPVPWMARGPVQRAWGYFRQFLEPPGSRQSVSLGSRSGNESRESVFNFKSYFLSNREVCEHLKFQAKGLLQAWD